MIDRQRRLIDLALIVVLGLVILLIFWARPAKAATAGVATWYEDPTPPPTALYAAVPGWHWGDRPYYVTVHANGKAVTVLVQDCLCGRTDRAIDLSPAAFSRLAPLSRGVVRVTIEGADTQSEPTLPPTDTE